MPDQIPAEFRDFMSHLAVYLKVDLTNTLSEDADYLLELSEEHERALWGAYEAFLKLTSAPKE